MKMKQLDVVDLLKASPEKTQVPTKACTLLKQSVQHLSLPGLGSTQILFPRSRFTGPTSSEGVPKITRLLWLPPAAAGLFCREELDLCLRS